MHSRYSLIAHLDGLGIEHRSLTHPPLFTVEQSRHWHAALPGLHSKNLFFKDAKDQDSPWRGARVYKPAVRRNIKLAEAPSYGKTIFEYARGCPGALDYTELARSMVEEWDRFLSRRGEVVTRPARTGAAVT